MHQIWYSLESVYEIIENVYLVSAPSSHAGLSKFLMDKSTRCILCSIVVTEWNPRWLLNRNPEP